MNTKMMMPIISKVYCSSSQVVLVVRRRPHVVNGGGLVVTDCMQNVVFKADGCGVFGTNGKLMLRDGNGDPLLLIRRKGGIIQALSIHKKWKGYSFNYVGSQKSVFSLKEESNSCIARNNAIRIITNPRLYNQNYDFEINGSFPDRACSMVDCKGNLVAQVGVKKEVEEMMGNKDMYHVVVNPGVDQAFVCGVIAVLDNIHGESTSC